MRKLQEGMTRKEIIFQYNLVKYLKDKDLANEVCTDLNINPLFRPEQLSPEMYLAISEYIDNK